MMTTDEDVLPSPLPFLLLSLPFLGMMSFSFSLDKMTQMTKTTPSQMNLLPVVRVVSLWASMSWSSVVEML